MKRPIQLIVAGVLGVVVAVGAVTLAVFYATNSGPANSSAAKPPPVPPLIPINTLVARVLAQKTPPPVFLTAMSKPPRLPSRPAPSLTTADAIRLAAGDLNGQTSAMAYARVDSVSYVQTTAQQALMLLDPARQSELPADSSVWAFVAYGAFTPRLYNSSAASAAPPVIHSAWAIVVQDSHAVLYEVSGQQYDLTRLGTPVQIPLSQWPKW